jgi:hypothetical protein
MTDSRKSKVQGEGDYDAARRYRRRTEEFVATHDVPATARAAAPSSASEEKGMLEAEKVGRSHAKSRTRPRKS